MNSSVKQISPIGLPRRVSTRVANFCYGLISGDLLEVSHPPGCIWPEYAVNGRVNARCNAAHSRDVGRSGFAISRMALRRN
jgi:hypothetical protein